MMQLLMKSVLGAIVYTLTLVALWWAGGRGDGAEAYLLEKINAVRKPKSA